MFVADWNADITPYDEFETFRRAQIQKKLMVITGQFKKQSKVHEILDPILCGRKSARSYCVLVYSEKHEKEIFSSMCFYLPFT